MEMTPTQQVELVRAACCIAAADGETSDDELALLKGIAHQFGGVGRASLEAMIDRAERDPEFHRKQFDILRAQPLRCLDVLLSITAANGEIKESEFDVLKKLATKLGVEDDEFRQKVTETLESLKQSE